MAVPEPRRRSERWIVIGAAVTIAAVALIFVVLAFRDNAGSVEPEPNGLIVYEDLGPQPETIPFDNVDLFALDPASGKRWNMTNTRTIAENSPVWSNDGSQVIYQRVTARGEGSRLSFSADIVVAQPDGGDPYVLYRCGKSCGYSRFVWSPDDRRIAFTGGVAVEGGGFVYALGVFDTGSGERRILCDSRDCPDPAEAAWSPDGSRIAFSGAGGRGIGGAAGPIYLAALDGSFGPLTDAPRRCSGPEDSCIVDLSPAWSPLGTQLAFIREARAETTSVNLMLLDVSTGDERTLAVCDGGDQCREGPIAWSPDGSSVAFVERYDVPVMSFVDVRTGGRTDVTFPADARSPFGFSWSPDHSELTFVGGPGRRSNLYAVDPHEGSAREVVGDLGEGGVVSWLPKGTLDVPPGTPVPAASVAPGGSVPDGTIYFDSSNGSNGEDEALEIWSIRSDGTGLSRLTRNDGYDSDPSVAPDGSMLAFRGHREGQGDTQLWVSDADGSDQRALTHGSGGVGAIAWSPVDDVIAFAWSGDRDHPTGLYVIASDGSGLRLLAQGNVFDPSWSPDGKRIVYADDRLKGDLQLYIVNVVSGDVTSMGDLKGSQMAPAWSPDGEEIAFDWGSGAGNAIFTISPDGTDLRKIVEGSQPAWSPDGTWLAFTHFDASGGSQIWLVARDGTDATPLTQMQGFIGGTGIAGYTDSPWWAPPATR